MKGFYIFLGLLIFTVLFAIVPIAIHRSFNPKKTFSKLKNEFDEAKMNFSGLEELKETLDSFAKVGTTKVCEYCNSANDAKNTKCESCGASLKK